MKIKDLLTHTSQIIENASIKDELKNQDFEFATEYLQHAKAGAIVFLNLPKDIVKSHEVIQKYKKSSLHDDEFLIVTNVALTEEYNFINYGVNYNEAKKVLCDFIYPLETTYRLVGVTGTNGKTSIVNMTARICEKMGKPVLSLGTVGVTLGRKVIQAGALNSTFAYVDIRRILFENQAKTNVAIMELTSHALKQKRLLELNFEHIFWTNFTQDHLDYHKTEEDYFNSKLAAIRYTNKVYLPKAEIELANKIRQADPQFEIKYCEFKNLFDGKLEEGFIKANLALALKASELILGHEINQKLGDYRLFLPEGRFETFVQEQSIFIVDYAHTPDALEKLLVEVQKSYPKRKRVLVFGCGGNRDRTKRKLMGEAAELNAEMLIVTSDNPRDEEPLEIIKDVVTGISKEQDYIIEVDRKAAILKAIELADEDHVIVVAGKGHEDYQEIKGKRHPFKDMLVIKENV